MLWLDPATIQLAAGLESPPAEACRCIDRAMSNANWVPGRPGTTLAELAAQIEGCAGCAVQGSLSRAPGRRQSGFTSRPSRGSSSLGIEWANIQAHSLEGFLACSESGACWHVWTSQQFYEWEDNPW